MAKSNNRTRGQFECDFVFVLISFTCMVRLLFHSLLERVCVCVENGGGEGGGGEFV